MENLAELSCKSEQENKSALHLERIMYYLDQTPHWDYEHDRIARKFSFNTFKDAMNFVNRIAELAELQQHHPDILVSYNMVKISLWTHSLNGLTINDFIMAAKIDRLQQ